MSNVQSGTAIIGAHVATAAPAKAVFTPARVLKFDLDGALSRRIVAAVAAAEGTNGATETSANISGRALRMGLKDYAAMAGRVSEDSVAGAIVFAVVHFMNGTANLQELAGKNVPSWMGARVAEAFSSAKPTNSCDEEALRTYAGLIACAIKAAVKPAAPKEDKDEAAAQAAADAEAKTVAPAPAPAPVMTPADKAHAFAALAEELGIKLTRSQLIAIAALESSPALEAASAPAPAPAPVALAA